MTSSLNVVGNSKAMPAMQACGAFHGQAFPCGPAAFPAHSVSWLKDVIKKIQKESEMNLV